VGDGLRVYRVIHPRVIAAAYASGLPVGTAVRWMHTTIVACYRLTIDIELSHVNGVATTRVLVES
jgi:hypothetical protein